jgi:succinoglycan biosynthesis transport protein ExoP
METQEHTFKISKYSHFLKRHSLPALGVFFPVFLISLVALSLKNPAYEAEGKMLFQRTNTISSLTGVGTEVSKLEPLAGDTSNPLNTEREIISSFPVVQKTINQLNLKNKKGEPLSTKEFIKQLTIKDVKGSDVLQISYKDTDPKTAAEVVNTLMQVYLNQNIVFHRMEVTAARKFLEQHLPEAELVVRKVDVQLRHFKEKNQVVVLTEEATRAVERMADLNKQIGDSKSRIAALDAESQAIRNQLKMNSQQAVTTTAVSQSRGVQGILTEIQQLETRLAARRVILQETHPEIIHLKNNLTELRKILKTRVKEVAGTAESKLNNNLQIGEFQQTLSAKLVELESTRFGLANQVIALSNLEANHRDRLKILPRLEQQQRELQRKLEAAQSTYSLLLQKLQESRIAENQNVGNAQIISAAQIPDEPLSSPMVSYLSAALIASLAGLASMYILEARDTSIQTVDEAKELLGLTLLAVIPAFINSKKSPRRQEEVEPYSQSLFVRNMPRSSISESYRMLRANLNFVSADKELRTMVITSSVPQEGKSTVAANLALTMAQMERKVLLVDADLHRPVQHRIWDLTNDKGLSNVIVGQAELKTAVKTVMDDLDVLTAGVVPPSPASLLDSKKMAGLIETFAAIYDFVIIDAPSLTIAADAATLGQMADSLLLVVRPGVVDSVNATIAMEVLEKSGQNVIGQVINGVVQKNERHSYYYLNNEYYPQEEVALQKS